MNADAIRDWLRREPFAPFEFRLSNDEHYEVRHPDVLALGCSHMVLVDPITDRTQFIALMHVNSIGALQTA